MARRKTPEEFIADAKRVHGDRYDYSLVEYVNKKTDVSIICEKHGVFKQKPNVHLQKKGCAECGREKSNFENTKPFDYFVEKAKTIHGDKYSYSNYIKLSEKLTIECCICGHVFEQRAWLHLQGQGCKKCAIVKTGLSLMCSEEDFIKKSEKVFGKGLLDYSLLDFKIGDHCVTLRCLKCDYVFVTKKNKHLVCKHPCPRCAVESMKLGKDEFVKRAVQKHGTKFDYTNVAYKKDRIKTLIKCNQCNSVFEQTPKDHLKIKGCPVCEISGGFDRNKKAILYYLKVVTDVGIFYKIGITNRTVEERYCSEDLSKIEIINIIKYKNGGDCYEAEQNILKEYSQYRYVGSKILKSCGDTELFTKDVLGLDV